MLLRGALATIIRKRGIEMKRKVIKAMDRISGFDGVIEGEGNTIALATAKRVAAGPVDDCLNPLVLVGPPGTGKTCILNAIATEIASLQDGRTVISTTGQQFRDEYINALENAYVPFFRDKFKMADVLLIEGAEVFEKSEHLAGEVLPIIDDLLKNGKQVVIALTRPLKKSKEINRSFYGRIVSSATLSLAYPDEDMKRRYIKSYLSMKDATLPSSKIKSILKSSAKSFWEIKGAVCTALCENAAG